MELWDQDAIDLLGPAFPEFRADQPGEFWFIAVHRRWAIERADGSLAGRIFFHMGDDSDFLAKPMEQ